MKGLRKFSRRMQAIPEAVKQAAQKSLDQSAAEVVAAQRAAVPREDGILASSIDDDPLSGDRIGRVILAGGLSTTRAVRNGQEATFDYALAQEFGTEDHSATPFFYGPYRLRRSRIRGRLGRAISRAIKGTRNG